MPTNGARRASSAGSGYSVYSADDDSEGLLKHPRTWTKKTWAGLAQVVLISVSTLLVASLQFRWAPVDDSLAQAGLVTVLFAGCAYIALFLVGIVLQERYDCFTRSRTGAPRYRSRQRLVAWELCVLVASIVLFACWTARLKEAECADTTKPGCGDAIAADTMLLCFICIEAAFVYRAYEHHQRQIKDDKAGGGSEMQTWRRGRGTGHSDASTFRAAQYPKQPDEVRFMGAQPYPPPPPPPPLGP